MCMACRILVFAPCMVYNNTSDIGKVSFYDARRDIRETRKVSERNAEQRDMIDTGDT